MRIQRIQIDNFRNFQHVDVVLGEHVVIVGENKVGKSNFLFALRLILDPTLADSDRLLQPSDFWEGAVPLSEDAEIRIALDVTDFEYSDDLKAVLCSYLIRARPMVARLNYAFRRIGANNDLGSSYEFLMYGADDETRTFGYEERRWMPLDFLPALRDAENDLSSLKRSPLRPLLSRVTASLDRFELLQIRNLARHINEGMQKMLGSVHMIDATLRLTPTTPEALLRSVGLFIDNGEREIGQASLGSANLLYISLKMLELQQYKNLGERQHTFLVIEEPEAHLHPHVQRLAYRHFLRKHNDPQDTSEVETNSWSILMSTHSPNIVSTAPLRSFVLLRRNPKTDATEAVSTASVQWSEDEIADIERYLDVTRGEILFARGVILVEGNAEEYLLPIFGKLLGYDFDEYGITVCSIAGVNFKPYVKLLGPQSLNIPFAVLTDFDPMPEGRALGPDRVERLLAELISIDEYSQLNEVGRLERACEFGIFLNTHTIEVDLFRCGCHEAVCDTLVELTEVQAARKRALAWHSEPNSVNVSRLLSDIGAIGKGRFAQRLALRLTATGCPPYIPQAIEHVTQRCKQS